MTALAGPSSAAPHTTPEKVCGSGYNTVNSASVGSRGAVRLTYNVATGRNCVATIRSAPGTATDMSAWIYVPDSEAYDEHFGRYTSYAGHLRLRQGSLRGPRWQHRQRQRPDHRLQLRRPRRIPGHHDPVNRCL